MSLSRRDCLKSAVGLGLASFLGLPQAALADGGSATGPRTVKRLVHVLLRGGADYRFLTAPEPDGKSGSYASRFFEARAELFGEGFGKSEAEAEVLNTWLLTKDLMGRPVRLHPHANWLFEELQAGRAAIVANVNHAITRNHKHAQDAYEAGIPTIAPTDRVQSGWGGRLLESLLPGDGQASLISLTNRMSLFTATTKALPDKVVCLPDTRDPGLPTPDKGQGAALSRALQDYYLRSKDAQDLTQLTRDHYRQIDAVSRSVRDCLAKFPIPEDLAVAASEDRPRQNRTLRQQALGVYDCLAADEVLKSRILHMQLGGFDTHREEKKALDGAWTDLFGKDGSVARLFRAVAKSFPESYKNFYLAIGTDFGRQLAANGDNGTDHGRGNAVVLWSPTGIRGGIYGDLFPESEDFTTRGADIKGQTDWIHVYGRLGDALAGGKVAEKLFPKADLKAVEKGVAIDKLFT